MSRQESNRELSDILVYLVETYPELRFGQILSIFKFVRETRPAKPELGIDWKNDFYTESDVILNRVRQVLKERNEGDSND